MTPPHALVRSGATAAVTAILAFLAPGSAWAAACGRLSDCIQNEGGGRLLLVAGGCVLGVICAMAGDRPAGD